MPAASYASISNLRLSKTSTVIIEIAGRTPASWTDTDLSDNFDFYNISGSLTTDGGKFLIRFFNGFAPVAGDRFLVFGCTNITENKKPVLEVDSAYPAPAGVSVTLEKTAQGYEVVIV